MRQPEISVVVPVRNRKDLLQQCLDRLTKQSADPKSFEIIVVDDGSSEDLTEIVREFDQNRPFIRLIHQSPRGPAAARNMGIRHAKAPLILFIDSDVLPDKQLVEILCTSLQTTPEWIGVEARLEPIGGQANPLWDAPISRSGGHYHTAAIAYRREALVMAGGFDEQFTLAACEDVELAVRILKQGPIGFNDNAVVYHPRRLNTFKLRWRRRKHWKFVVYQGLRYGFLAWPNSTTRFPRIRTAIAAVLTLPLARIKQSLRWMLRSPHLAIIMLSLSLFDILCGIVALPEIAASSCPERLNYLD